MHGHKDIVEMLLDRGADINMADNYGFTPLHEAAIHSQVEVVQFLIERGAKLDTTATGNLSGRTPLHSAAREGKKDVQSISLIVSSDIVSYRI